MAPTTPPIPAPGLLALALLPALLLPGLPAAQDAPAAGAEGTVMPAPAEARTAGADEPLRGAGPAAPGNEAITEAVRQHLGRDPGVRGENVDVRTRDGIVTLTGVTGSLLARERAGRIARTVKGVRSVVNRLQVPEPAVTREALEQRILDALILNPATDSYELGVDVEAGGAVTLVGTVDSWKERELAATVAKSVRGVTGVSNRITLSEDAERLDSEIEQDIESAMRWDVYLDDALVRVEVDDARVRLSGTVGSAAEKSRAITRSWVRGVEAVDAEGLEVAYWARDEELRSGKYVTRSDRRIRDAIQDALLRDPRVFLYGIDVEVDNGVASLDGTVSTLHARRAAAGVARGTVGVWRVRNELSVTPPEDGVNPAEVGAAVRGAIERDPYLEPYEITVRAGEDRVTLDGTVETRFEKARAERVASRVPGVAAVANGLRVSAPASPLPADPYVDDWRREDFAWEPPATDEPPPVRADHDLAESVHDELWWSPFVDADDVTVTVDDGVVTLTGTVDSWTEREAAEENAREGGALRVVNRLDVDFGPPPS